MSSPSVSVTPVSMSIGEKIPPEWLLSINEFFTPIRSIAPKKTHFPFPDIVTILIVFND